MGKCDCLTCRQRRFFIKMNGHRGYTGPEYLIPKEKFEIRATFLKPDVEKLWDGMFSEEPYDTIKSEV